MSLNIFTFSSGIMSNRGTTHAADGTAASAAGSGAKKQPNERSSSAGPELATPDPLHEIKQLTRLVLDAQRSGTPTEPIDHGEAVRIGESLRRVEEILLKERREVASQYHYDYLEALTSVILKRGFIDDTARMELLNQLDPVIDRRSSTAEELESLRKSRQPVPISADIVHSGSQLHYSALLAAIFQSGEDDVKQRVLGIQEKTTDPALRVFNEGEFGQIVAEGSLLKKPINSRSVCLDLPKIESFIKLLQAHESGSRLAAHVLAVVYPLVEDQGLLSFIAPYLARNLDEDSLRLLEMRLQNGSRVRYARQLWDYGPTPPALSQLRMAA